MNQQFISLKQVEQKEAESYVQQVQVVFNALGYEQNDPVRKTINKIVYGSYEAGLRQGKQR